MLSTDGLAALAAQPGRDIPQALLLERVRTGQVKGYRYPVMLTCMVRHGALAGLPAVSADPERQAHYVAMRLDGTGHGLAEMLALQRPPMSNTDREFLQGHCNGNQFAGQEAAGDYYRRVARAAGVDVTGAVYQPGLARSPGDPEAWVRGRGDVERVARERGWGVTGAVNVRPRQPESVAPDTGVAEDLVDARVSSMVEANPDLARTEAGELRHQAREEIKPHWAD